MFNFIREGLVSRHLMVFVCELLKLP